MKAESLSILGAGRPALRIWLGLAMLVVVIVTPPATSSLYVLHLCYLILVYSSLALSWNLMARFTGYISFGHGMFFGIGMYTSALLLRDLGLNPWFTAPFSALVAAVIAFCIGLVCLKLRGPYFAVVTLALALIFEQITLNWTSLTGGGLGVFLRLTEVDIMTAKIIFYFYALVIVLVLLALTWYLPHTRFGYGLMSVRENEEAAEAAGVPTTRLKVTVFVLSALFPGLTGAIHGYYLSFINPQLAFDLAFSVIGILSSVLGGIGTLWGPALGATILTLLGEWIQIVIGTEAHLVAYGLILVIAVLLLPDGLIGGLKSLRKFLAR